MALWRADRSDRSATATLEVLFVGGDLTRKGGDLLIEACARLRGRADLPEFVLHLVTGATVEPAPGVVVHHGLTANSPELIARFHAADVFALPTLGDCLPLVLAEAGAAGLPMVSTDVGAIGEIVVPGVTGELVRPGNVDDLTEALARLLGDRDVRRAYGDNARRLVEQEHDARANTTKLLALLATIASADA